MHVVHVRDPGQRAEVRRDDVDLHALGHVLAQDGQTWRPSTRARTATKIPMASATTVSHTPSPVAATSQPARSTPTEPRVSATTSR